MTDDNAAQLMDEAAAKLRDALHASYGRPAHPSVLHSRAAAIVDILSRVQQAARMLSETTMAAPSMFALGSDDETAAGEHVATASSALDSTRALIDQAHRLTNQAFSALSHLKLES